MGAMRDIAKNFARSSSLTGKDRLKTDDLISTFPEGVTVTKVHRFETEFGEEYFCCEFAEADDKYFSAPSTLKDIIEEWRKNFDGDMDLVNDGIAQEDRGGVKMKFQKVLSKNKRYYTATIVL